MEVSSTRAPEPSGVVPDPSNAGSAAAAPPPTQAPSISLPKGGGAIRDIGEKFAANPVTGTGSISIPLAPSPGRNSFAPQLSLAYDSGSGNGPFGFGWDLRLPAVTRKTDKGLPRYVDHEESDVFLVSGSEDLVPALEPDGTRFADDTSQPGYVIHRYRPRVEGGFVRIERWTRTSDGDVHWRSLAPDNTLTVYGRDANSRIADPANSSRIYSWLVSETRDDKGSAIVYDYAAEDDAGVDLAQANERNRGDRSANRYPKRIRYGNRTPLLAPDGRRPTFLAKGDVDGVEWLFEVVFDYDEGYIEGVLPDAGSPAAEQLTNVRASTEPAHPWPVRPDPFSSYRAGFEVRTYRRCRRVLISHRIPDLETGELGYDGLVRATQFDYADLDYSRPVAVDDELTHQGSTRIASFIRTATRSGYTRDETVPVIESDGVSYATYVTASLPPLEFTYSKAVVRDDVLELDDESLENLPVGLDGSTYQWVDLDGEGVSGILTEQAGSWFYKRNLGGGSFGPLETIPAAPAGRKTGAGRQLLDLDGDGRLALVSFTGPAPGFFERTDDAGWEAFQTFRQLPVGVWDDPNLRFVDLDGDGHADVLVTEQEALSWYPSLAEEGFGPATRVRQSLDEETGPRLLFADGTQSIYLADMSGDGLTDLVRIRNGGVCYWPNLGYGRFGAKVALDNAPVFDNPEQFEQRRVRLADIDGSGTSDVLYLGRDTIRLYFNQCGNRLSDPRPLPQLPHLDNVSTVMTADLLAIGTTCLVWSSSLPGDARRPLRYVDLMGGTKPHLLIGTKNDLGAETRVDYAPSTRFYLDDRSAGRPWATRLPFPVHVVERVSTLDQVSGNRFISRYAYHHGYYDGIEREFRGFGLVEQWDTEEYAALTADGSEPAGTNVDATSHVPPVHTKTWFHTGVYFGRGRISDYFAGLLGVGGRGEYYREPGLMDAEARALLLDDTVLPDGLTADEQREACRALKGSMLRQEIYGLDGSPAEPHPYIVTEQNMTVRMLQPRGDNRHAIFLSAAHESLTYHYERDPADPRIGHTLTLEIDDYGAVVRSAAVGYGRRQVNPALDAAVQAKQAQILVTYTENDLTNAIDTPTDYRTPLPSESRTYELTGLTMPPGRVRYAFDDVSAAGLAAAPLQFEDEPTDGTLQKRLIEHGRTYYRRNDLTGPAPLGALESLALPYDRYKLAFTPGLVALAYGGRLTDPMLADEGRYVHSEGDAAWWVPSGRVFYSPNPDDTPAQELALARQHFFQVRRYRNPFYTDTLDTETIVNYDAYDLLLRETRDALGNTSHVGRHDYRILQAAVVVDMNGSRTEAAFDALGLVTGRAVMGKDGAGPVEGDSLAGFHADLTPAETAALVGDPSGPAAAALLGGATTRVVYDAYSYLRQGTPTVVVTISRRTHESDLTLGQQSALQISLSYCDGFGRGIQSKSRVRPGPAPQRDGTGAIMLGPDGQPELTPGDITPRWLATGWTVFNNKGRPVRQYEPFFTDTHRFEFDVRVGVSPIVFYDPVGRAVGTIRADHTWGKTVFGPWRQEAWDENDTLFTNLATDAELGGFCARLPAADYLPTWAALRTDPLYAAEAAARWPDAADRDAERRSAEQAAMHSGTPSVAHADSLGRTILTVVHNRFKYSDTSPEDPPQEEFYTGRVTVDIRGNQREVVDAKGRVVARYDFDVLGRRIHQASMETGERWSLYDVGGTALYSWDSRDHRFRTDHDALHRPTATYLSTGGSVELLIGSTRYGESEVAPEAGNLRGRVAEVRDQAGVVTTDSYDFEGNLLRTERRLANVYSATLDWSQQVAMHNELYTSCTRYDALGRAIQMVAPHSDASGSTVNVIQPVYDEGGLLEQLHVWQNRPDEPAGLLDPTTAMLHSVADVLYDAKGRRLSIDYGNGVTTRYTYDALSHRLSSVVSTRDPGAYPDDCPQAPPAEWPGCRLQNLHYAYDPAGNVMAVRDTSQQTIFFRNRRVTPDSDYTYDAVYRLIEATGREHLGQVGGAPIPHSYNDVLRIRRDHPCDGNAMGRYIERYVYDAVGNFLSMKHRSTDPANPGWTCTYAYGETSQLEATKQTNRLTSTSVAGHDAVLSIGGDGYDPHGNLLQMPQLQTIQWDYKDALQMTRRQAVDADDEDGLAHVGERTWYVYDATGQRIRKVTEDAGGAVKSERLYLGGSEIYRRYGANPLARETLHVMDNTQRVALVETRTEGDEPDVPGVLVRYQLGDHLGSVAVELDETARIISYEEYTPFGSTSYQGVRGQLETPKRYRFTGTERDEESGLNYNAARYYAPWLGRWISADPIGIQNGTSVYVYCRDNPVSKTDTGGMQDEPTTAVGITLDSRGVSLGPFLVPPPRSEGHVVALGRSDRDYMGLAERNTGLTSINIQDSINIRRGLGIRWTQSLQLEQDYLTGDRPDNGGLHPMYSGHMVQEALEGNAAGTAHIDMRDVDLTPPLREGTSPGFSPDDFHSSSEGRQVVAHLASTDPGQRKVDIVIQHEDGVSTIPRDTNAVQGDPLPSRLADRMPNINNNPGGNTPGGRNSGTSSTATSGTASTGSRSTGSSTSSTGRGGGMAVTAPSAGSAALGAVGRMIPGVAEGEAALLGAAGLAASHTATVGLVAPLMTAAEALPVAAGVGVVGAGAGHLARAGASALGASQETADGVGFVAAVATGAALGSFIPGVGTAVGAGIGAIVAGGLYLWSIW
jgi:RHS repeat-associated protein